MKRRLLGMVLLMAAACGGATDGTGGDTRSADCHPSYPTVCLQAPPPDLNCDDISDKNFTVTGTDPHRLDANKNGIACEEE